MAEILPSAARTVGGTQRFTVPERCKAVLIQIDVTAAAEEAGDLLKTWVQGTIDDTNYYDIGRFADILGNGGTKRFIMVLQRTGSVAESDIITPTDGELAAEAVDYGPFPDELRLKWTVTDATTVGNASFTFSVDIKEVMGGDLGDRTKTYIPDFTTARDQVRLKVGDTDVGVEGNGDALLFDDEIEQAYAEGGSIIQASVLACRWMIAKLAPTQFDKNIDGLSTKRSQRVAQLRDLLSVLIEESKGTASAWSVPATAGYTADTGEPGKNDGTMPPIFGPCDVSNPPWEA
jgi:hypothetical protein